MVNQSESVVFVKLLDEGVDVWRPVRAEQLSPGVYRIPASADVPSGEQWEFSPGFEVHCEFKQLSDGRHLVAVRKA